MVVTRWTNNWSALHACISTCGMNSPWSLSVIQLTHVWLLSRCIGYCIHTSPLSDPTQGTTPALFPLISISTPVLATWFSSIVREITSETSNRLQEDCVDLTAGTLTTSSPIRSLEVPRTYVKLGDGQVKTLKATNKFFGCMQISTHYLYKQSQLTCFLSPSLSSLAVIVFWAHNMLVTCAHPSTSCQTKVSYQRFF